MLTTFAPSQLAMRGGAPTKRELIDMSSDVGDEQTLKRTRMADAAESRAFDRERDQNWRKQLEFDRWYPSQLFEQFGDAQQRLNQAEESVPYYQDMYDHFRAQSGPLERNEDAPDDPSQGPNREDAISNRIDAQVDEQDSLHNLREMQDDVTARELDRDDALKEYQDAVRESANLELPGYRKKNDPLWFREEYDSGEDDLGDMEFTKENINSILRVCTIPIRGMM